MGVSGDAEIEDWYHDRYRASGKKLDMGKSCVRFRRLEDVPFEVVAEVIWPRQVDEYVARYEASRGRK